MNKIFIFICVLLIKDNKCFKYNIPGNPDWPKVNDFLSLKRVILGKVILRGEPDYKPHTWNRLTNTPKPALIVKPENAQDVIETLKFSRKFNLRLSVQSTGHHQDHRNIYDNSIHLDMSSMNHKTIDLNKKTLTLGPGNNFSQIHSYVATKSNRKLVAISGADPGVGIYGWTAGGGHGLFTKQYGLGVDNLLSIDLVLANFTIITASETQNKELFRAIRGSGGGTYGIAISLTVKLHENPGVLSTFSGYFELSNTTAIMFANWLINAPNRASGYFLAINLENKYVNILGYCFGNTSYCTPILSPLKNGCLNISGTTCEPNYEQYSSFYDYFFAKQSDRGGVVYLSSTGLNSSNIVEALKEIVTYIDKNQYTLCYGNSVLGGVSSLLDLNQEKTSVSLEMRKGLMAISCASVMTDDLSKQLRDYQVGVMDYLAENIMKKYSKWVYWNEPQHNFPSDDWQERYWGDRANYDRLLKVKKMYDPNNIFTCYHCIGYQKLNNEDPSVCPITNCTCSNTPNGTCARTESILENLIFYCNFDNSICDGKISSLNLNGQKANLLSAFNTASTKLGYDVTDITSTTSLTSSNKICKFPFVYQSKNTNFCVKMSNGFNCKTNDGYSKCKLGKFLGIEILRPSKKFSIVWEKNISLLSSNNGIYNLNFNIFYNCYQTKKFFEFKKKDCFDVKDRLTVYVFDKVIKQFDLSRKNSFDKWRQYSVDFKNNARQIQIKFKVERVKPAQKGEAIIGLDEISLINRSF